MPDYTIPMGKKRDRQSFYKMLLHLHPKKVKESTLKFSLTFGLGGMTALSFVILVLSGLLLKIHYKPSVETAYASIVYLNGNLLFGKFVRNVHHWSAILMLFTIFLHMLRVIFTYAYKKPREKNWIIGIILFILVVFSNFTGYLLPWDQVSYWAITISVNLIEFTPLVGTKLKEILLGGTTINDSTLVFFYSLHTGIIPIIIILCMSYHFWYVRMAGGVIVSEKDKDSKTVPVFPNLVAREFIVSLVLIAFLFTLSVFFDAPLHEEANPGSVPNPLKAPWYFMGFQELLIHFHPLFAITILPVLILVGSVSLPYITPDKKNYQGIWFLSGVGKKAAIISSITTVVFTVLFVLLDNYAPKLYEIFPDAPSIISMGIVPFLYCVSTILLFLYILKKLYKLNKAEYIQSLILIIIVTFIVLTVVGIWFRGRNMQLIFFN